MAFTDQIHTVVLSLCRSVSVTATPATTERSVRCRVPRGSTASGAEVGASARTGSTATLSPESVSTTARRAGWA